MAAPTLAEIREGLRKNLAAIDGAQISAYRLANPTPPTIQVVYPEEVDYHGAMNNGLDNWTVIVMAFVGLVSDTGAQMLLDEYIGGSGAKSVRAAVEADKTLGGKVNDLIVQKCSGYREYEIDLRSQRAPVLGAEWTVEILADGS